MSFFAFDSYKLPRSSSYIDPIYRGVAVRVEDDHDDEERRGGGGGRGWEFRLGR